MRWVSVCVVVCLCIGCPQSRKSGQCFPTVTPRTEGDVSFTCALDWVELTGSGDRFSFKEVDRRDGSLELFDESRGGVGVRLFVGKSEWRTNEETRGKWAPLWSGAWTTDADLRPEFEKWGLKPVRQGDRGTCSVFTTNSALEFAFSRYMGKSVQLSVEYLNS